MNIIGNEPDIFDQMPYVYGVDYKATLDKRIYNILPQKKINTIDSTSYCADSSFSSTYGFNRDYYVDNVLYDSMNWSVRRYEPNPEIKYSMWNLFYCGKVYLIAQKVLKTGENIKTKQGFYKALPEYYMVSNKKYGEPYYIIPNENVLQYAKDNNLAFFLYYTQYKNSIVTIQPQINYIPLHKIKLPIFDDVNKVYNDIYNQILSYKNDDDCVEVSNDDKIKQAGFDLKTSFRNM